MVFIFENSAFRLRQQDEIVPSDGEAAEDRKPSPGGTPAIEEQTSLPKQRTSVYKVTMNKAILLIAILLLPACGFSPIYGKSAHNSYGGDVGTEDFLAVTSISNIPDREGQYLRNRLVDRFYRNGYPATTAYHLNVSPISESIRDLDITKTADSTRAQLTLQSELTLHDPRNDEVLLRHRLRAITSYNILASEFSTRVAEQAARENALNDLARQIETQLVLYFKQQN